MNCLFEVMKHINLFFFSYFHTIYQMSLSRGFALHHSPTTVVSCKTLCLMRGAMIHYQTSQPLIVSINGTLNLNYNHNVLLYHFNHYFFRKAMKNKILEMTLVRPFLLKKINWFLMILLKGNFILIHEKYQYHMHIGQVSEMLQNKVKKIHVNLYNGHVILLSDVCFQIL